METTTAIDVTGFIPAVRLPELDARVAKINKQARKVSAELFRIARSGVEELRIVNRTRDAFGRPLEIKALFIQVTVSGVIPKLPGGWSLLAVIDRRDSLPIVNAVPGCSEVSTRVERERGPVCDHCKKSRRRAETFLVQDDAGEIRQVGRQCLADFLGLSAYNPAGVLAMVSFLRSPLDGLDESGSEWGADGWARGEQVLDVLDVTVLSAACIDENGWVSRARAEGTEEQSTRNAVSSLLFPPKATDTRWYREWREWADKVQARLVPALEVEAAAALEWARGFLQSDKAYLYNLAACATCEVVGVEKLGLVVSLIAAYRREQAVLVERERKAKLGAGSRFVGEIKKRNVFELTLLQRPIASEGSFGTTYRCEFADASGNLFVWWASDDPTRGDDGWQIGASRKAKATVKKHEEFRGVQRTVINRVVSE